MHQILIGCFLVLPFAFIVEGPEAILRGHSYFLMLSALAVVAWGIPNAWIRAFLSYACLYQLALFVLALARVIPYGMAGMGMSMMLFFLAGSALYLAVRCGNLPLSWVMNAACVAASVQATLAVLELHGVEVVRAILETYATVTNKGGGAFTGSMVNANFLTGFVAISFPFFFRRRWWMLLPLICYVLWTGKTSTAMVSAFVAVMVLCRSWKLAGVAAIVPVLYMVFADPFTVQLDPDYTNGRMNIWTLAVEAIGTSWFTVIFGLSPGVACTFPVHNEYLQCWLHFGYVGLVMMVGYLFGLFRGADYDDRDDRLLAASMAAICANMLGNYPLHLGPSAFLIILVAAAMERHGAEIKQEGFPVGRSPVVIFSHCKTLIMKVNNRKRLTLNQ